MGGIIVRGLDLGGLASFLQYSRQFGRPVNEISSQYNSLQAALAGAERIFQIMDEVPEVDDAAGAVAFARHRPVEEREIGSGAALGVGIEQMISAYIVLVDRTLDQTHAERLGVEAMILFDRRRNRGEVMNTGQFHDGLL